LVPPPKLGIFKRFSLLILSGYRGNVKFWRVRKSFAISVVT
jgi:hypothetical protein